MKIGITLKPLHFDKKLFKEYSINGFIKNGNIFLKLEKDGFLAQELYGFIWKKNIQS